MVTALQPIAYEHYAQHRKWAQTAVSGPGIKGTALNSVSPRFTIHRRASPSTFIAQPVELSHVQPVSLHNILSICLHYGRWL